MIFSMKTQQEEMKEIATNAIKELNSVNEAEVQTQQEEKLDEFENAALMFNVLSQQFRQNGYKLAQRKKRSAVRVLEALLFSPLEEVELIGKEETDLLQLCHQIMYYKMKINEYAIMRSEAREKENQSNESKEI